jgi:hypothetical protein
MQDDAVVVYPPIFEMYPAVKLTSVVPVASCVCCGVLRAVDLLDTCAFCGAYLCGRDGCPSDCSCEESRLARD